MQSTNQLAQSLVALRNPGAATLHRYRREQDCAQDCQHGDGHRDFDEGEPRTAMGRRVSRTTPDLRRQLGAPADQHWLIAINIR
jgi:hypothetical protein